MFCPKCGGKNDDDAKFCASCGEGLPSAITASLAPGGQDKNSPMEPRIARDQAIETTDSWPLGKIFKHILLPKPKGSPKAGKKEIALRVGFATTFGVIFLVTYLAGKSLPSCDQAETTSLVAKIINDMPLVKRANASFVSLKDIKEQGHNKEAEIRACNATLVTTAGENNLQYSIKWQDKKGRNFYVEAQIVN